MTNQNVRFLCHQPSRRQLNQPGQILQHRIMNDNIEGPREELRGRDLDITVSREAEQGEEEVG